MAATELQGAPYVGREVYYTGDVANVPGYGRVITYRPATRWGPESVDVQVEAGSAFGGVFLNQFAEREDFRRFWWLEDWRAYQARRVAEGDAAIRRALEMARR